MLSQLLVLTEGTLHVSAVIELYLMNDRLFLKEIREEPSKHQAFLVRVWHFLRMDVTSFYDAQLLVRFWVTGGDRKLQTNGLVEKVETLFKDIVQKLETKLDALVSWMSCVDGIRFLHSTKRIMNWRRPGCSTEPVYTDTHIWPNRFIPQLFTRIDSRIRGVSSTTLHVVTSSPSFGGSFFFLETSRGLNTTRNYVQSCRLSALKVKCREIPVNAV